MSNQLHSLTLKKLNAKYAGTGYTFKKIEGVMGFEISFDGWEICFMEVQAYLLHLDRTMKECPWLNGEYCPLPTKVEAPKEDITDYITRTLEASELGYTSRIGFKDGGFTYFHSNSNLRNKIYSTLEEAIQVALSEVEERNPPSIAKPCLIQYHY